MKKNFIWLSCVVLLTGCFEETVVTNEYKVGMEIVKVVPGHKGALEVDLQVIGTNQVYRHKTLSCWYSQFGSKALGTKWDVTFEDFKRGDFYGTRIVGLNGICHSLRGY